MAIINNTPMVMGGGGSVADTLTRFTKTIKSIKELLNFAQTASKMKHQNQRFIFDYAVWRGDGSLNMGSSQLSSNQLVFTGYGNNAKYGTQDTEVTTFTGQHSNTDGKITGWVTITIIHPAPTAGKTGGTVYMQVPIFLLSRNSPYYAVHHSYIWCSGVADDIKALDTALSTEPMTISYYADTAIK